MILVATVPVSCKENLHLLFWRYGRQLTGQKFYVLGFFEGVKWLKNLTRDSKVPGLG